jgi:hypothetical protein
MSAPLLGELWQDRLAALPFSLNWDGAHIDQRAIKTVESIAVVPCSDGGLQLELHRDGLDIEFEINPDGTIGSVLVGRAS